ncbi:hypothetical protein WOLCODRAFT_167811 [Wolfiporia cocos MD-104 SS10]|uniref:Uncharacterized protein n=1 Tax=Wolfiporia cocos (strain MD-104) TaxID=742152 RepID=A0A2H3JA46_WOLCO|nr:hypothetical protein WOLCODRAFT_167811 [Wolfiporia cocos MD-104 SS10]
MTNPYAPVNETSAEIWFEESNYVSTFIGAIAYGVHIVIFFTCVYYLIKERGKHFWQWLVIVFTLFSMATINICINIRFGQLAWIDDRNYPGGPLAYLLDNQSDSINTAGNATSFVALICADGILIFRVLVLWQSWYIVVFPFLMWLASTALSILVCVQTARPNSSLWANNTFDFYVPYWSISIALNIILTLLLITRLMYVRQKVVPSMGGQYGKLYTAVATMVLESALPYSVVSIIFIILYGMKVTAENLFIPLLVQVACIAPEVIILRVTRGRALSSDLIPGQNISSMKFGSGGSRGHTSDSSSAGQVGIAEHLSMMTFPPGSAETSLPSYGKKAVEYIV